MTLVVASAPGSASRTFVKQLEFYLKTKALSLKNSKGGIGHLFLNSKVNDVILNKLKLDFLRKKTMIINGHIFPTESNLYLLNKYYKVDRILITYRNIFEQLNYFYKWQKYNFTGPLNFNEDIKISSNYSFSTNSFDVDLSLLLTLNFYKQWFFWIQKDKNTNYTLFSYKEIISLNKNYQNKVSNIFKECKIEINKIVSFEYAKNFLGDEDDKTMCISAKKVLNGINKSEVKIQEINQSKSIIFDRLFNFFD